MARTCVAKAPLVGVATTALSMDMAHHRRAASAAGGRLFGRGPRTRGRSGTLLSPTAQVHVAWEAAPAPIRRRRLPTVGAGQSRFAGMPNPRRGAVLAVVIQVHVAGSTAPPTGELADLLTVAARAVAPRTPCRHDAISWPPQLARAWGPEQARGTLSPGPIPVVVTRGAAVLSQPGGPLAAVPAGAGASGRERPLPPMTMPIGVTGGAAVLDDSRA